MAILNFDLKKVVTLCKHAKEAPSHQSCWGDESKPGPALWLVGDQGVYLMSNGTPGLPREPEGNNVAYAEGMNPLVDDFDTWWANKRAYFGGDDGADTLPWCDVILDLAEKNPDATKLQMNLTGDALELRGVAA